jgi:hypothetical protein
MALKVAIVGLSQGTRHLAPWNDPEWEIWGLAWDVERRYQFHRAFEMHDMADLKATYADLRRYLEKIAHCSRLYMVQEYQSVPGSIAFPFDEVEQSVGDYWCSSIAYAMSLAIHEGAEEIGLYGIDMKGDDEWGYQKPNMEYLIGFARGRGIKVHIPETSPLCKFTSPPDRNYAGRYGRS